MTNEEKEKFFELVGEAYGDMFPMSYDEARQHDMGDGLADFIRIELEGNIDWEEESEDEAKTSAIWYLDRAIEDIGRVILKLEEGRT